MSIYVTTFIREIQMRLLPKSYNNPDFSDLVITSKYMYFVRQILEKRYTQAVKHSPPVFSLT